MELTKTSFKVRFKYGLWLRVQYMPARVHVHVYALMLVYVQYSRILLYCITWHL